MNSVSKSINFEGRTLTLETGKIANLADSAVLARYGDTMVLATVVVGEEKPELGYFPLTVEYIERLYAGGRIKGSRWVKREGRPSDEAILKARLVDRSIRPLFPKDYFREIQIIITVLSVDSENDPDILSIIATSAALAISEIPWNGPVAGLRIGYFLNPEKRTKGNSFIFNPSDSEMEYSDLDLVISATKETILMVEASAKEVPEEIVLEALALGQQKAKEILSLIEDFKKAAGRNKVYLPQEEIDTSLKEKIKKVSEAKVKELLELTSLGKVSENTIDRVKEEIFQDFSDENVTKNEVLKIIDEVFKEKVREKILKDGIRPDGRGPKDIRPIEIEVGILPRTHGSALFKRGDTQALTVVTLGSPTLRQYLEFATGEETKRYIHHYNMPPYSVGETGRLGWPARREIGHGALAERALLAVIPSEEVFPYTIRVVSEIMSSNGSTSMASVCGSTLALMDAGVPIKEPVAGIAMGLITNNKKDKTKKNDLTDYVILSDIIGFEDFFGDMDFKVAGTKNGITALQLDVKIPGLTIDIFRRAFAQAKEGREFILSKMLTVLPSSRKELSKYAPRVSILHIDIDKIGEVIGPGGRTIRKIMAETGATIDIDDDGVVNITGVDKEAVEKATAWVNSLTREIKIGEIYEAEVKRIQPFGAFAEIFPGKEGLIHVSEMTGGFVSDPNKIVKVGQKIKVKVIKIDDIGRISLSMLLDENIGKKNGFHPKKFRPFDRGRRR